jgi:PAS domain S-box-containing protein
MQSSRVKNFILIITLIIIFLIDFGLIVNTNNKWNETVIKLEYLNFEEKGKEEYIKKALENRQNEFLWTLSLFALSNFIGIILLFLYRKEKKDYEISLHNEKEKAIITLKSIGDAVITIDEKAIVTFINPIAENILKFLNNEVVGKEINEVVNLIDIETKDKLTFSIDKILKEATLKTLSENICLINKHNKLFEIEESISPIRDKQGMILGVVFIFRDVTEQNEYRRKLIENEKIILQQSKNSAMVEMLENMAHHWRQPLSVISTLATALKLKKELNILEDEYLIKSLSEINEFSQKLSSVIDDFTIFLNPTSKNKEFFYIDISLTKTLSILESKLKTKNIKIICNVEKLELNNYEKELMQVFMCFINNSIDALDDKNNSKFIFINMYKNENEIIMTFLDNGGGIDTSIENRIFEPYFTTRYKTQGKGIGLYMTRDIVTKVMNGKINFKNEKFTFNNEEFYGAKFTVILNKD